jgi:hypothetical protein
MKVLAVGAQKAESARARVACTLRPAPPNYLAAQPSGQWSDCLTATRPKPIGASSATSRLVVAGRNSS